MGLQHNKETENAWDYKVCGGEGWESWNGFLETYKEDGSNAVCYSPNPVLIELAGLHNKTSRGLI